MSCGSPWREGENGGVHYHPEESALFIPATPLYAMKSRVTGEREGNIEDTLAFLSLCPMGPMYNSAGRTIDPGALSHEWGR